MDGVRFDQIVRAVGKDPSSRRKLLAGLTLGVIGGVSRIPFATTDVQAGGSCGRGRKSCAGGCCPKRAPVCCRSQRGCCKKGYRCGPGYCYR
jgi:hypothetical protein